MLFFQNEVSLWVYSVQVHEAYAMGGLKNDLVMKIVDIPSMANEHCLQVTSLSIGIQGIVKGDFIYAQSCHTLRIVSIPLDG